MRKYISLTIGIVVLVTLAVVTYRNFPTPSNIGYQPDQPIPFSHALHAGQHKMACQYCHADVEHSKHASVPAVGTCMNCHHVVKTDSPWIKKIQEAYENNKPIEWIRIHELPDFVYFPHKRHVAKGLACQTCHGPIETMDKVYQYSPLTMGWCMECHRGRTTPQNVFEHMDQAAKANLKSDFANAKKLGREVIDSSDLVAPVNCSTCHY